MRFSNVSAPSNVGKAHTRRRYERADARLCRLSQRSNSHGATHHRHTSHWNNSHSHTFEARKTRGGVLEIKMCGVYPGGPGSPAFLPLFSCEKIPETIAILGFPRLNPTHFAFRPLRATERIGSGCPRSADDRCTRGDPGRRQTKHSGRAERIGSGCLRQRAPNIVRSTLRLRTMPKPNEAASKNEATPNWCLSLI